MESNEKYLGLHFTILFSGYKYKRGKTFKPFSFKDSEYDKINFNLESE